MTIRYSGDVEVRIRYASGVYHGSVRSPGFRGRGTVTAREVLGTSHPFRGLRARRSPTSNESYDRAALLLLRKAEGAARDAGIPLHTSGKGRGIEVRRTFQSPCPYRS